MLCHALHIWYTHCDGNINIAIHSGSRPLCTVMATSNKVYGSLFTGTPLKDPNNKCYFSDPINKLLSRRWGYWVRQRLSRTGTVADNHFPQDAVLIVNDDKIHVNKRGKHAEMVMMANHKPNKIHTICMNYTPCDCCATKMIEYFEDIDIKPVIKVLWLYKYPKLKC